MKTFKQYCQDLIMEANRAKITRALANMQAKDDPNATRFKIERFRPMFKHLFIPKEDDMIRRINQGTRNIVRGSSDSQNAIDQINKLIDSIPKESTARIMFRKGMHGKLGYGSNYKGRELTDQEHQARKDLIPMAVPKSNAPFRGTNPDELATRTVPIEGGEHRPETTKEKMQRLAWERLVKHGPYQ